MRCDIYIPVDNRQCYVYDIEAKKRNADFEPLFFRFFNARVVNRFFHDQTWWECYFDDVGSYDFLAVAENRCRFLRGTAVWFPDDEMWCTATEEWCDEIDDDYKIKFLRHKIMQIANPKHKLHMPLYDHTPFHLSALFRYKLKQNKIVFQPFPARQHNTTLEVRIRTGPKRSRQYIYNLFLIRKASVLKIANAWRKFKKNKDLYKN